MKGRFTNWQKIIDPITKLDVYVRTKRSKDGGIKFQYEFIRPKKYLEKQIK